LANGDSGTSVQRDRDEATSPRVGAASLDRCDGGAAAGFNGLDWEFAGLRSRDRPLPQSLVAPGHTSSGRVELETVLAAVREAYPNEKLSVINLPQKPDEVYEVQMQSPSVGQVRTAYVNPYNGELLGWRLRRHSLMGFLYELHAYLLGGETRRIVIGISGLLLLLFSITGLFLWPGWRRLVTGLKIRWRAPRPLLNYDIHKVGGVSSVVFLILTASTGALLGFWTQAEPVVYWLTHTPQLAEPASTLLPGKLPLALDEILPKADAALPGAQTIWIELPSAPQAAVSVRKKFPQETDPYGDSLVYLDQYSGKVLRVDNALKAPLGAQIMNSLYPVHTAAFGGLKLRTLYVFLGLIPTLLLITGLAIRWSRTYDIPRLIQR